MGLNINISGKVNPCRHGGVGPPRSILNTELGGGSTDLVWVKLDEQVLQR